MFARFGAEMMRGRLLMNIVPKVTMVREWNGVRRIGDTERGLEMRRQIALLEKLVTAYRENRLRQR